MASSGAFVPTHPYPICNGRLVDTLSGADSPSPPQTHPLSPWLLAAFASGVAALAELPVSRTVG